MRYHTPWAAMGHNRTPKGALIALHRGRFRIVRHTKMAQAEPEIGGHLAGEVN